MQPLRMLGFLMLMFALCDADSMCPTDLNPLSLDPPELLGEVGQEFFVNCTSTDEYHDGMYWSVNNTDNDMEDVKNFVSLSLSLKWNVTAECKIDLDANNTCSKDLEITVYKNPEEVIIFPIKYDAVVEGTQYELQCDIINVAPVQNLTVRWYKNNQTIRTHSFNNTNRRVVTESSTLKVDVSRKENEAQFRCEAQLDFGPLGSQPPVTSDTQTVFVLYAPELKNNMEDVYVDEGSNVTLHCEAEGHPPPRIQWTLDEMDLKESASNLNLNGVTDSATYNCTASNYLGNITKQIHVHVMKTTTTAAPAAAHVTTPAASTPEACPLKLTPAEIVVRFGDPASVNCSTSVQNDLGMGWEATHGSKQTMFSPFITWTVKKLEDWTIRPMCYINLAHDQCYVASTVTLYKTPDIVFVSLLDQGPMVEGREYTLMCDALNVAPVRNLTLTWYRGDDMVKTQKFNDTRKVPGDVFSTYKFIATADDNEALFSCVAELHLGLNRSEVNTTVTSSPYKADVHYKPLIKDCPNHEFGVEYVFSMDLFHCETDGNPPPTVQWYYEGELINASEPLNRDQSGEYTAEFANILGRTTTSVNITIEYGPSFTCGDHYEVHENGKLQCKPDGLPEPTVTFHKDGKKIISPPRWTKHDSGNYSLVATNQHGTASHELYVDVLYAPVFKEGSYNFEVNLGENVTFDCNAEGNPSPEVRWNNTSAVNVRETTRGRHSTISVTRATSTNAGVYSCVATNRVGNVTRSVRLETKDKTRGFHKSVIWWILILLVIVLFIILIIFVHNRCTKHGQYSFARVPASDATGIPMTPQSNGVHA